MRMTTAIIFCSILKTVPKLSVFPGVYTRRMRFKILLYFPDVDRFAVSSEIYERYAFDSYFTVTVAVCTPPPQLAAPLPPQLRA